MSATTSSQLCTLLDRMSWAQSAAEQKRPTRSVRLHALPPTMWIRATRGVGGTKTIAGGVLPATITWTGGTVHLAGSDEAVSTGWRWMPREPSSSARSTWPEERANMGDPTSACGRSTTPPLSAPEKPDGHSIICRRTASWRSEEHTSELQSRGQLVCRRLLEKKTHAV